MPRVSIFPIALMIAFAFIGCGDSNTNVNQNSGVPVDSAPFTQEINSDPSQPSRPIESKIKLKDGEGGTAFSVKRREDGFELRDKAERTIITFHLIDNRLKIKTLDGSEVGDVTFSNQKFKIQDATKPEQFWNFRMQIDGDWKLEDQDDQLLGKIKTLDGSEVGDVTFSNQKFKIQDATKPEQFWNFRMQIDGDWKLEDQDDQLLGKIKKRDYGYEIEDPTGRSLYKSKLKDGKHSLRDHSDKTLYYTKDTATPLAIACMGFDVLKPHIKAALMTMVLESDQQ